MRSLLHFPPPRLFRSYVPPAESCCLGGKIVRTVPGYSVRSCHLRVFFACLMNHVYIPNSSSAPVSYYTQGYTEWDFSLNDRVS